MGNDQLDSIRLSYFGHALLVAYILYLDVMKHIGLPPKSAFILGLGGIYWFGMCFGLIVLFCTFIVADLIMAFLFLSLSIPLLTWLMLWFVAFNNYSFRGTYYWMANIISMYIHFGYPLLVIALVVWSEISHKKKHWIHGNTY